MSVIRAKTKGDNIFTKPDKIYLNNTNLYHSYCNNSQIGIIREVFFASMLFKHQLEIPKKSDFLIDDKYIFEVGGKKKGFKQIKDIENSFVIADDIVLTSLWDCRHETSTKSQIWEVTDSDEIGFGNKIPLWLFGFLY